jgi:hypothetical protein
VGRTATPVRPRGPGLCSFLADHGDQIRRTVTPLPSGVEAQTESLNPGLVDALRDHIVSVSAQLLAHHVLRPDDPLFQELLRNAGKITVFQERTPTGIRVVETSSDPHVVGLIQANAHVVSSIIANGRVEMMRLHSVPAP